MRKNNLILNRRKNKRINSKVLPIIFSTFLILILSICFIANKKDNIIYNSINKNIVLDGTEIELDNWEISTVFYDSTVNNGKTPLTEINWDASNTAYSQSETRTIKVQINYKNTNCLRDYDIGDITFEVPNLAYHLGNDNRLTDSQLSAEIVGSFNDDTHSGYDWALQPYTYTYPNTTYKRTATTPTIWAENFILKNEAEFSKNTNFEGAIQIIYTIKSNAESSSESSSSYDGSYARTTSFSTLHYTASNFEGFKESCLHSYNKTIKPIL